jgi:hypothetical protein
MTNKGKREPEPWTDSGSTTNSGNRKSADQIATMRQSAVAAL